MVIRMVSKKDKKRELTWQEKFDVLFKFLGLALWIVSGVLALIVIHKIGGLTEMSIDAFRLGVGGIFSLIIFCHITGWLVYASD